jgi:pimeloyl-ACP methyl ester carboxylesterase
MFHLHQVAGISNLIISSAVIAVTDHPDKISGLVLLGSFAREVPVKCWQKLLFGAVLAGPWGRGVWVSYYKRNLYPGAKPDDLNGYVLALSKNLSEPGRFKAFKKQAGDTYRESGQRLEKVNKPCLIIMGTADPDFPDPQAEATELAELMKGDVLFVEGSGHYPQADNPEEVAKAIIGFIKRIETNEMET